MHVKLSLLHAHCLASRFLFSFSMENVAKLLITLQKCKNTINYVQIYRCWHVPQNKSNALLPTPFYNCPLGCAQRLATRVQSSWQFAVALRPDQTRPRQAAARLALTAQLSCVRNAFATRGKAAILCFALLRHQAQTMSIGYTLALDWDINVTVRQGVLALTHTYTHVCTHT